MPTDSHAVMEDNGGNVVVRLGVSVVLSIDRNQQGKNLQFFQMHSNDYLTIP